jgi:hypothetical protein
MSVRSIVARHLQVPVAAALFATLPLGTVVTEPAHVQAQEGPYQAGATAEVGDGWLVTLVGATIGPSPGSLGSSGPQLLLTTTWEVRNTGSYPRYFPTDRLRIVGDSGGSTRVASCEAATNPLELSGRTAPGGSETGSACWLLNARDAPKLTLSVDPPAGDAGRPPVLFAANPTYSAETATAPPAPSASPLLPPAPVGTPPLPPAPSASSPMPPDASPRLAPSQVSGTADASSSSCAPVYSAYANSSGGYLGPACGVAATSSGAGAPPATTRALPTVVAGSITAAPTAVPVRASACRLYPSGAQPPNSTAQVNAPTTSNQSPSVAVQGPSSGMGC